MLDIGTYGAKVQSWRGANPRELLRQVVEENRNADRTVLLSIIRDMLLKEESIDFLDAVIEYWFANNYHSLVERQLKPATKSARAKKVAAVKSAVTEKIKQAAEIMLLDMVTLPSGRTLRDSTGKECAKAGGLFARIAEQVKPGQKVGTALSEDQVRAIWKAA